MNILPMIHRGEPQLKERAIRSAPPLCRGDSHAFIRPRDRLKPALQAPLRVLLAGLALALVSPVQGGPSEAAGPAAPSGLPKDSMTFLGDLTREVVQGARVKPGAGHGGSVANSVGFTLIMPGGNYPAFWIRDFSMGTDSGFVTPEEMLNHLRLTARGQNGATERKLANGLVLPPYAIPDHINFNGKPVFYPGTYSSGNDQGNGTFGFLPPVDDHFEFVHIAYRLYRATGKADFLQETINGMTLLDRLVAAFHSPAMDPQTALVTTDAARRAVGFGFCDTVYLTGKMLFPSLLRYRAAGELAELLPAAGQTNRAAGFRQIQRLVAENLASTFSDTAKLRGWLKAATGVGQQADVWGTLYALYLGVLKGDTATQAEQAVLEGVRRKTMVHEAAVRHVPTDMNYSANSAWERTAGVAINTYQNGAYWHTPTGWLIAVVARQDRLLAQQLFDQYIQHLRQGDYRLGGARQAPWECFAPGGYAQNGVYMASVALPFSACKSRLNWLAHGPMCPTPSSPIP